MASTTPRFSVKPGLCQSTESGVASKCWLSANQCSGTWVSGMEMLLSMNGGPFTDCVLQSSLQDMHIGQCTVSSGNGEDTVCAPNPESCSPSSKTSSTSAVSFSDWTMTSTEECVMEDSHFGSCDGDDGTVCRYSPEQCPDDTGGGVDWTFPHEACSCDRVQVGACHNSMENIAVCAVNEQACSVVMAGSTAWIPVENVLSTLGYECFLCRESATTQEEDPILDAPSSSTSNTQLSGASGTSSGSKKTNGVIVGATVSGLVVAMLLLVMALMIRRRSQSASWTKTLEQENALPPQDVVFGNDADNGMAFEASHHKEGSTLDDDDVSVL